MNGLQEFKDGIAEIFAEYDADDEINYVTASTRMEIEIERFSVANAIDMPDEAMDEIFSAFSELQIKAFEKEHVSEAEACHMIHDRAKTMFEDSRGWQAVEAAIKPYVDRIEGNTEEPPQQFGQDQQGGTSFGGPLGFDMGLN